MTGHTTHAASVREDFATTSEEKIRLYGDGTADNTLDSTVGTAGSTGDNTPVGTVHNPVTTVNGFLGH